MYKDHFLKANNLNVGSFMYNNYFTQKALGNGKDWEKIT